MSPLLRGSVLLILLCGLSTVAAEDDPWDKFSATAKQSEQILPFGGKENEERLKQVIKETIKPRPVERKPLPANVQELLAWSEPVNGLAARVEYASGRELGDVTQLPMLIRLKNVSEGPLTVPTGSASDPKAPQPWEIYTQLGSGPWRQTKLSTRYFVQPGSGLSADLPTVTLKPGEHYLACVCGLDPEETAEPRKVKAVLRCSNLGETDAWNGVVETPPHPAAEWPSVRPTPLAGLLPFPDYFPAFIGEPEDYVAIGGTSGPTSLRHRYSNPVLIDALALYDPAGIRKEFEQRLGGMPSRGAAAGRHGQVLHAHPTLRIVRACHPPARKDKGGRITR